MFVRFTLNNGTHMWHRADMIRSVEKDADTRLNTIVWIDRADPKRGMMAYEAEEAQQDIVDAICEALKTGTPQVVKKGAEKLPPPRLIS